MSTNLGAALPDDIVELLSGDDLPKKVGLAFLLVSHSEDGYPHPCIVTPGEIVAADPETLRLALYAESTASRNLRAGRPATLCLAHGGAAYYVKTDARPFAAEAPAFEGQLVFTLQPHAVLRDSEAGTEVTSSFRFEDQRGDQAVLARWEPLVAALRATFGSDAGP